MLKRLAALVPTLTACLQRAPASQTLLPDSASLQPQGALRGADAELRRDAGGGAGQRGWREYRAVRGVGLSASW